MQIARPEREVFDAFAEKIAAQFGQERTAPIAIAVSGGGDSIALMHMAARLWPASLIDVLSVNHGLRAEASEEIAVVKAQAQRLGLRHTTLRWAWDGQGNLQAAARDGRFAALRDYCLGQRIDHLLLGHTEDDQIETLLMRLARGSGVDGLTGMAERTQRDGVILHRPLLGITRQALRTWLQAKGLAWCEDPSNDDPRYQRVRARQMLAALGELGLTRERLLMTAQHMRAAQATLIRAAKELAARDVRQEGPDLLLSSRLLPLGQNDSHARIWAEALRWVGGQSYRPRFDALTVAVAKVASGKAATLSGCLLLPERAGGIRVTREAAATQSAITVNHSLESTVWDHKWQITGPFDPTVTISALKEAIAQVPNWRAVGLPRKTLLATPAIRKGGVLIAAPVAGFGAEWVARIVADFHSTAFAIED